MEKIIPDNEFLEKSNTTYDNCTLDVQMICEKGHLTEEQKIDLLKRLDEVRSASKEDMIKGTFYFAMWVDWFQKQLIITQIKNVGKKLRN